MTRKFLIAIEGVAAGNSLQKGNICVATEDPLSMGAIEMFKREYCSQLLKQGVLLEPENTMVLAVIPLES